MGLKIEAGKRYVTRSGWVTPPVEADPDSEYESSKFFCGVNDDMCAIGVQSWSEEGRYFNHLEDGADLVAEFVEIAPLPDVPDDYDHLIIEKMREYGGGFVKTLAVAYLNADPTNRGIIRNTFREYWQKYSEIVAADVDRANGGAN